MSIHFLIFPLLVGLIMIGSAFFAGGDILPRLLVGVVGLISLTGAVGLYLECIGKLKIKLI